MSATRDTAAGSGADSIRKVALPVLLLTMLGLRLHLLLRMIINWDEFHYLSFVYDFVRQAPLTWRQTFHVHLFPWLTAAPPDNEVAQVLVARVSLFALGLASSGLIYFIGRRFLSRSASLFAVLCYNALTEVIIHGASFRPDPLATFLFLAITATVLARPASATAMAAAGLMLAVSFMLTLKTAFFLPSVAILILTFAPPMSLRRRLYQLTVLAVSALVFGVLLWIFHRQAIVPLASDATQVATIQRIATNILWTGHWLPGRFYILRSLTQNALIWMLLAGGLVHGLLGLRSPALRRQGLLPLLALALPLGVLLFYRNSFPYFFAYLLAPAILLCGLAQDRLRRLAARAGRLGPVLTLAIVLGVFATGVSNYLRQLPFGLSGQRQLIATIHRMFPAPVPYLDRCSMIASFPKVGFFMSTWGMERYAGRQRPVLAEAVRTHAPPFLVANNLALNPLLPLRYHLLAEDRRILQQNYIHHWGIIFVAGKSLDLTGGEATVEILIPGPYTLEAEMGIQIDGRLVRPNDVIELETGLHQVTAESAGAVTLRWGDHLYRPERPPPREPIFIDL